MNGVPEWFPPTVAISLMIIALSCLAITTAVVLVIRQISERVEQLQKRLEPALRTVDRLAEGGEDLGNRIKSEVHAVLRTSRYVRRGVIRGVRRVRGRLQDLDALYEVIQDEVQDTALDVAAKFRTLRQGTSILKRIRRMIRGRR